MMAGGMQAAMGRMGGGMGGGMAGMSGGGGMAGMSGGGMGGGSGGMSGMSGGGMGAMMRPRCLQSGEREQTLLSIAAAATELAARDKNPQSKTVLKKLEEPISMSLHRRDAARRCPQVHQAGDDHARITRASRSTSTRGPQGGREATTSTVSNLDLEGVPLKTTLRLMLKQMGLAYCVRDGVLIISSVQGIFDELREAQEELEHGAARSKRRISGARSESAATEARADAG